MPRTQAKRAKRRAKAQAKLADATGRHAEMAAADPDPDRAVQSERKLFGVPGSVPVEPVTKEDLMRQLQAVLTMMPSISLSSA